MSTILSRLMNEILIIIYINTIVWLLVPIRQIKTNFFLFFVILGALDPIYISCFYLFKLNVETIFLLGTGFLTFGAFINFNTKHRLVLSSIITILCVISILYYNEYYLEIELIIHLAIFFNFLAILLKNFSTHRDIKYFSLLLVLYEISLLVKFYLTFSQTQLGPSYFHFTSIIQIIIGIFFLFINEKNSKSISFN